ncbi:MAG: CpaF family protein [Rhodoferax sp.]|nr:CpaF family protein [Rhodoferax sp.]
MSSLRQRLFGTPAPDTPIRVAAATSATTPATDTPMPVAPPIQEAYLRLKSGLHMQLLERMDLGALEALGDASLRREIARLVEQLLTENPAPINEAERRQLVRDIQHEMLGLGPLELLMADPQVSDILVNSHDQIYVEREGRLVLTTVSFTDDTHLMRIIDKIVSRVGRRIDESSPMVDARLPDGSRVNAIIPPIALDGPMLSIRRFAAIPLRMKDLLEVRKSLSPPMAVLLGALSRSRTNMLISGGTGSGKTTLLNILSGYIPASERIITIEDAAELPLQQPHVVRLETRPPNTEGRGEINQCALVRNALRMRPDRIVIGEVRGAEAIDMLQAMNTGHEGSLTTIHANNPRDALARLESMVSLAGVNMPLRTLRQQIASALSVVIQVSRLPDGQRKVMSIQEISGMEGEVISLQELFRFQQTGVDGGDGVLGHFEATGVRPGFADRLRRQGLALPDDLFDPAPRYP